MSTENIKAVARRLAEAHGQNDVQAVRELLSPGLVWRMAGVPDAMGRDDYLKGMESGRESFSDLSIVIEDEIAEGDTLAVRWTIRMRHTGTFEDIAPTGRKIEFTSIWFYRVVENRIVQAWSMDEHFIDKLRE
jgi:predicted ester cyclase